MTPPNPNASYEVDGSGPLDIASPHWYWNDLKDQTSETVSCTVALTPPTGQGAAFNVTVSQKVIVRVPDWAATGTGGYMQVNTSAPQDSNYELWAGPGTGEKGGMYWNATVSTPTQPTFGTGKLEVVQTVTSNDSYTTCTTPRQQHNDPLNGQTGLDGQCPIYNYVCTEVAQPYQQDDNPGLRVTGIGGSSVAASATFKGSFKDYLMYEPPNSAQWVPLSIFTWSTNGVASIPTTGSWSDYATQHGGSDAAGTVSPSTSTPFVRTIHFPSWTQIITPVPY